MTKFLFEKLSDFAVSLPFKKIDVPAVSVTQFNEYLSLPVLCGNVEMFLGSINIHHQYNTEHFVSFMFNRKNHSFRDIEFRFYVKNDNLSAIDLFEGIKKNTCLDRCNIYQHSANISKDLDIGEKFSLFFDEKNNVSVNNIYYCDLLQSRFFDLTENQKQFYSELTEEKYIELIKPKISIECIHNDYLVFGDFKPSPNTRNVAPYFWISNSLYLFSGSFGIAFKINNYLEKSQYEAFSSYLSAIFIKDNKWDILFDKDFYDQVRKQICLFKTILKQNQDIMF